MHVHDPTGKVLQPSCMKTVRCISGTVPHSLWPTDKPAHLPCVWPPMKQASPPLQTHTHTPGPEWGRERNVISLPQFPPSLPRKKHSTHEHASPSHPKHVPTPPPPAGNQGWIHWQSKTNSPLQDLDLSVPLLPLERYATSLPHNTHQAVLPCGWPPAD